MTGNPVEEELEREEVAIVGLAGRFPGARDIHDLWHNLSHGVESIRLLSHEELAASGVDEETAASDDYVAAGAPLEEADCFEASFFGIRKAEAELMDPQHRVLLECAWAALEDAGHDPATYEGRIGVFGGVAPNPIWTLVHLLATMKNERGEITIEGLHDQIEPPTELERQALAALPVNVAQVNVKSSSRRKVPSKPYPRFRILRPSSSTTPS